MPAWLPLLKASLPYIAQVVATAAPAFTAKGSTDPVVAQQIEELQDAVTKNAESIQLLAEKLQQTIQGIEVAAATLQRQVLMFRILLGITAVLALLSTVVLLNSL